jgi:hypothetical protein
MIRDPTARDAWKYLEDEFLGQRESRALLIEAEFRSFKQGVLSVTDYCRRLETMAAFLKEFGDPIGDRQLVLTLLRGLNAKFRHMVSNLKMQRPFPTLLTVKIRQPSHEFTFGVGISFILYPLVLTPVV